VPKLREDDLLVAEAQYSQAAMLGEIAAGLGVDR
jgi:hypothetical protein